MAYSQGNNRADQNHARIIYASTWTRRIFVPDNRSCKTTFLVPELYWTSLLRELIHGTPGTSGKRIPSESAEVYLPGIGHKKPKKLTASSIFPLHSTWVWLNFPFSSSLWLKIWVPVDSTTLKVYCQFRCPTNSHKGYIKPKSDLRGSSNCQGCQESVKVHSKLTISLLYL